MPTLHALAAEGDMTIGELAESLGVAQPGVTRNAAQLESLGLVRTRQKQGGQEGADHLPHEEGGGSRGVRRAGS